MLATDPINFFLSPPKRSSVFLFQPLSLPRCHWPSNGSLPCRHFSLTREKLTYNFNNDSLLYALFSGNLEKLCSPLLLSPLMFCFLYSPFRFPLLFSHVPFPIFLLVIFHILSHLSPYPSLPLYVHPFLCILLL